MPSIQQDRSTSGATNPNQLHPTQRQSPRETSQDSLLDPSKQPTGSGGTPGQGGNDQAAGAVESGGAAGALVSLTAEQEEKIRRIILKLTVAQEPKASFAMRLGEKVPEKVGLQPMPREVVDMVPAYKNFSYIVVSNRIVIVERDKREIDRIIPV